MWGNQSDESEREISVTGQIRWFSVLEKEIYQFPKRAFDGVIVPVNQSTPWL
jgi:hypothetical protein